jgi:IrrE N-terminal-like domain
VNGQSPAELLLKRLGVTEPEEIDLGAIAWELGVRIKCRPLNACEARIVGANGKAIITVNSRSSRRRRRFSIGHELGHWHYDRGRVLICQADEIGQAGRGLGSERAADRFASNLLMPDYLFRPAARAYPKVGFQTVRSMAELFGTSTTATAIRLVEGGYFPAVLVCHGPRGRKWFARSPDVPERWFPRDDLAAESFAFGVLFGNQPEDAFPRKIDADAWFDRREADRYEVLEQIIRTAADETLTLVIIVNETMLREYGNSAARFSTPSC